jgi:hypothetical protein
MELFSRLKTYLGKGKPQPWPYGISQDPSENAKRAWQVLGGAEKLMISCHSPFKRGRNKKLRELNEQGLGIDLLCEISGVSRSVISKSVKGSRRKNEGRE